RSVDTDDVGAFRVSGLASGDYYVVAQPKPSISDRSTAATTGAITYFSGVTTVSSATAVKVAAGQTLMDVEFHLAMVRSFQLAGVVVSGEGEPVAGAVRALEVLGMPVDPGGARTGL